MSSVFLGTGEVNLSKFIHEFNILKFEGPIIMQLYRDEEGLKIFKEQFKLFINLINRSPCLRNKIAAIILARGGSKGIPSKKHYRILWETSNGWTIAQCLEANIADVYVSSDSLEILEISSRYGAVPLTRPKEISGDI